MKRIIEITLLVITSIIFGMTLNAVVDDTINVLEDAPYIMNPPKSRNPNIPCQNLDALDSIKEIMFWEIQNDTLRIWTVEDEKKNELERIKYIRSLNPDDWE